VDAPFIDLENILMALATSLRNIRPADTGRRIGHPRYSVSAVTGFALGGSLSAFEGSEVNTLLIRLHLLLNLPAQSCLQKMAAAAIDLFMRLAVRNLIHPGMAIGAGSVLMNRREKILFGHLELCALAGWESVHEFTLA
jgi:hypothetical protein